MIIMKIFVLFLFISIAIPSLGDTNRLMLSFGQVIEDDFSQEGGDLSYGVIYDRKINHKLSAEFIYNKSLLKKEKLRVYEEYGLGINAFKEKDNLEYSVGLGLNKITYNNSTGSYLGIAVKDNEAPSLVIMYSLRYVRSKTNNLNINISYGISF